MGIMASLLSFGVAGVNGYQVHVEVFGTESMPGIEIIGLPDASVKEKNFLITRQAPAV